MYTSMMLFALVGFFAHADAAEAPTWLSDYGLAREQGQSEKKPLAVFICSGKAGWEKLSQDGKLGKETERILAADYVSVYIDTATEEGKSLAATFEMGSGLGIVISDHTGLRQAFRHEGDLANADLIRYLQRYADPQRVVRFTETNPAEHRSYYHAPDASAPASYGGFRGRGGC